MAMVALAIFGLLLLGGQAKADVAYVQACQNGQCSIQALPLVASQALMIPLAASPTIQATGQCSTGSCSTQSASFKQTVKYTSSRRGLFTRLFSRGSARSCR